MPSIRVEIKDHVAALTLSRPQVHNAFDETAIAEMTEILHRLGDDDSVHAIVLRGEGKSFSAGADLAWMQRMASYSAEENFADAMGLATMLRTLDEVQKPTLALVHGAAVGGGVGLVAACDIAVAAESASFALSEVKLGLIPATISPYVIAAMGERACRRYFLTAERFSAADAFRYGLVHETVPDTDLERAGARVLDQLKACGPKAQASAKDLIRAVARRPLDSALAEETARRIAAQRVGAEGREGVAAFLEKRKPAWIR